METDHTPQQVLDRAVSRIVEVWPERQLTVLQAVGDVQRAEPRENRQSAEDRTRGYEYLFELSPRQQKILEYLEKHGRDKTLERVRGLTS